MEDHAIVELYWARESRAIEESDRKYGRLCRSLAADLLASREDAEECVNDAWLRAWNTMPPQRPGSLGAFLARITRNLSIDRWRAARAKKRGEGLTLLTDELEDCVPAPAAGDVAESREIARVIGRWLESLPAADRVAFVRRYWYGQRLDELAASLGEQPARMAQRMYRLRLALRRALEEEGVSL
ncbi:MAG: sigma-70 family RNA polymerase sigma factor [Oscillospiraceae bacterium]|nr:sigma-70 family RNA polymerase sigma factor [Oscillospiraceae bacterium]